MKLERLLPLSGVVAVALIALGVVLSLTSDLPSGTAPAAEIVAHYDEHGVREFAVSSLLAAAVPFLVLFAVGAAAAASRGGDGARVWERLLVGGGAAAGAVFLVVAFVNMALVDGAGNGASPQAVQALALLVANAWIAHNAALGVLMLGAAGTFLSRPRSHAVLGWTALPLGIALIVPFATFFGALLTALWIPAAGIALSRGERSGGYAAAARPA